MKLFLALILSIIWAFSAHAEAFNLQCKSKKSVGYRLDADLNGKTLMDDWSDEGSFNSDWNFQYSGSGDAIIIDGEQHLAFLVNNTILAIEYAQNGMSQSLWSYAINLQNMEAVATQVNASNVMGPGIKGRTVSLSCTKR